MSFSVDVGDGRAARRLMIKPPDFDPKKRHPVLFYVRRAWGQTVTDS
jgi:dipeptidyl-peptidase-4